MQCTVLPGINEKTFEALKKTLFFEGLSYVLLRGQAPRGACPNLPFLCPNFLCCLF